METVESPAILEKHPDSNQSAVFERKDYVPGK
jgi:hypothetical protein